MVLISQIEGKVRKMSYVFSAYFIKILLLAGQIEGSKYLGVDMAALSARAAERSADIALWSLIISVFTFSATVSAVVVAYKVLGVWKRQIFGESEFSRGCQEPYAKRGLRL